MIQSPACFSLVIYSRDLVRGSAEPAPFWAASASSDVRFRARPRLSYDPGRHQDVEELLGRSAAADVHQLAVAAVGDARLGRGISQRSSVKRRRGSRSLEAIVQVSGDRLLVPLQPDARHIRNMQFA